LGLHSLEPCTAVAAINRVEYIEILLNRSF
jgi:hypothetical protein